MSEQQSKKKQGKRNAVKSKNNCSSDFTLTVLKLIGQGQRPSQIAKTLGLTDQDLYYHTKKLRDAGLIVKEGDRSGIRWKITEKGLLVLKELNRQSVDGRANKYRSRVAVRLHNVAFRFPVFFVPDHLDFVWKQLQNGVYKCKIDHHLPWDSELSSIKEKEVTVELVKSQNEWKSALVIHMPPQHFTNPLDGIVELHNDATSLANTIASRYNLTINQSGSVLVKRPHMAFEKYLSAILMGSIASASAPTRDGDGRSWIDSSLGEGELETNDFDYYYLTLRMPETIQEIAEMLDQIRHHYSIAATSYEGSYHPIRTTNN